MKYFFTAIFILLIVYIVSLNFAVAQTFRREERERDLKVLRQDLQKSEEFFISKLSEFYGAYSAAFSQNSAERSQFVSRGQNFAGAAGPEFR